MNPGRRETLVPLRREADGPLKIAIGPKPVAGVAESQCLPSAEGIESCRARHVGTKPGTAKPAVFAPAAATRVRRSTLFDPMMRTSFASTSTR
jgi:hypothetical protein